MTMESSGLGPMGDMQLLAAMLPTDPADARVLCVALAGGLGRQLWCSCSDAIDSSRTALTQLQAGGSRA
jgi:hypothetical protein